MSTQTPEGIWSLPAGADLSGSQFCAVVINTSGQFVLPAAGVKAHGILQNLPKSGKQARVYLNGRVLKAKAGTGGVTAGAPVSANATGAFITNGATGAIFEGIALEAVAAGGIFHLYQIADLGAHA
jgi:hypothetical protein